MRKLMILGAILALLGMASPAQALPLAPGGTVPASVDLIPAGSFVVPGGDTGLLAFTMKNFKGTATGFGKYEALVVHDSVTGKLDFLYQVSLNKKNVAKADVGRVAVFDFSPVKTDVGFQSTAFPPLVGLPTPTVPPTGTIDRLGAGGTVGFNFSLTQVFPGETSAILVIKTNATAFTTGNITINDGSGNSTVAGFAPLVIPEPSSMALLATGVLGLGGYAWRRRKLSLV